MHGWLETLFFLLRQMRPYSCDNFKRSTESVYCSQETKHLFIVFIDCLHPGDRSLLQLFMDHLVEMSWNRPPVWNDRPASLTERHSQACILNHVSPRKPRTCLFYILWISPPRLWWPHKAWDGWMDGFFNSPAPGERRSIAQRCICAAEIIWAEDGLMPFEVTQLWSCKTSINIIDRRWKLKGSYSRTDIQFIGRKGPYWTFPGK